MTEWCLYASLTGNVDVDDVAGLTECVRHRDAVSSSVVRRNSVDDEARHCVVRYHLHLQCQVTLRHCLGGTHDIAIA